MTAAQLLAAREAMRGSLLEPGTLVDLEEGSVIYHSTFNHVDDIWWASRDVQDAHDRFRRYYLGNGKTLNFCRCMAHVEPHLHAPRRLRRIGHLPMMTMKELPE